MRRAIRWILSIVMLLALAATLVFWQPWRSAPSMAETATLLPAPANAQPPPGQDDLLAVFMSGDGGWRDLDQQVGRHINAHGIPVVGISALEYYWHGGSAEHTAQQLDALIDASLASQHKRRLWLIGFSFGADILPTVIGHLTPEHRALIAQVVLLSPSTDLNFEIELEGYMRQRQGWLQSTLKTIHERVHPIPHYPSLPPLLALNGRPPVICYYGVQDDDDTVCKDAGLPAWIKVYPMQGDHHFNYDYEGLARRMIGDLPAKAAATR